MSARSVAFQSCSLLLLFLISYVTGLQKYAAVAFLLQCFVFAVHGWPQMSEKFYDASGSLTHLALIVISLLESSHRHPRQMMCSVFGIIWLTRLGSFLFQRILRDGKDTRFDKLKKNGLVFFTPWVIQALWVFLIDLPIIILNTMEIQGNNISMVDILSWTLWSCGFFIEVIADAQKFAFRNKSENHDKFITTGLWAYSQHPNYFGELVMWSSLSLCVTPSATKMSHLCAWISPAFTYVLLLKISGVNLLKIKADKKWKGQPKYDHYTQNTPEIIPKLSPTVFEEGKED